MPQYKLQNCVTGLDKRKHKKAAVLKLSVDEKSDWWKDCAAKRNELM